MLNKNLVLEHKKSIRPNKLPFLQAQILTKLYLDIANNIKTTLNSLSLLTDYNEKSKILKDAIKALIEKGYLTGDLENGFQVPTYCYNLLKQIKTKNDYKNKTYLNKLEKIENINEGDNLLYNSLSIEEVNDLGNIHHWYDYLEDFPYALIANKIKEYNVPKDGLVVDPFIGSGTTAITSNFFGINAVGFDANPLMTFISKVKTNWDIKINEFDKIVHKVASEFISKIHNYDNLNLNKDFIDFMPKKELNQWLSPALQKETNLLKQIIVKYKNNGIRDLLLLALIKSCLDASYVQFCPGTTFYPFREKEEFWTLFTKKVIQIKQDLILIQKYKSLGKSVFHTTSCLNARKHLTNGSIDFMITSPPYPNDLEYTRQTRLEMYVLNFVKNMNDVQNIKKQMVKGSTKLIFKESDSEKYIDRFHSIKVVSQSIYNETKDKNWGFDYPRMVKEYFGDMFLCMKEFKPLLKKNSNFLLVVGDQTIKGVYIPVCDILIEMAHYLGYKNCRKELFRVRRSTGHDIALPEEIVILQK